MFLSPSHHIEEFEAAEAAEVEPRLGEAGWMCVASTINWGTIEERARLKITATAWQQHPKRKPEAGGQGQIKGRHLSKCICA